MTRQNLGHLVVMGLLCAPTAPARAIIVRHDVPVERYQADAEQFPQLAYMPNVGHGVLIAPQWVVTAAHTIQGPVTSVTLAGVARAVERVEIHSGYRSTPNDIIQRALENGKAQEINGFLAGTDDIALLKLSVAVADVTPVQIYTGNSEVGRMVQMFGRGATGNGIAGETRGSPQRGELRRAFNKIDSADGRWLVYTFDNNRHAHRQEGMVGSGDSGGPLLTRIRGRWVLVGLASWKGGDVDVRQPSGRYGQPTYNVRIGHYADWIETILGRSGNTIHGVQ